MVAFKDKIIFSPPRPRGATPPETISKYRGWYAQRKWNGTRNLLYIMPDGSYELWNRHKSPHKQYKPSSKMNSSIKQFIATLKLGHYYVFDSELMHNKTKTLKDKIVLFDVLVYQGEYLLGSTTKERYDLLVKALKNPDQYEQTTGHQLALRYNDNLWLTEMFTKDLDKHYKEAIHLDEIEGLVLKDPNSPLDVCVGEENNGHWQIRVRKKHANYAF